MKTTSQLLKLMNYLNKKRTEVIESNYAIPELWNCWGYQGSEVQKNGKEYIVNPYNYYYHIINDLIIPNMESKDYAKPYYIDKGELGNDGDWIKESVVYSMLIRTSSAWDHDKSGELDEVNKDGYKETGTFVKTLALLPLFKKMGIDVIYLLPISKYSLKNKKGDLGSPYSIANFMELDPNLADPMVNDELSIDEQFTALVEACHILGMKVLIDIIPRTIATNNDLLIDNPEWFYWIKSNEIANYQVPRVDGLGETVNPVPELMDSIYQSEAVWKHIKRFSFDPKTIDQEKYKKLVEAYLDNPDLDFVEMIKEAYQIQIAPAFSDQINDPQPPWSDITFFRMYNDHPVLSTNELQKYVDDVDLIPPYILFDTIKCNLYQGKIPNQKLWDFLAGIIPYYQKHYGIDGARIDMGHALSKELLAMIISKAREYDPHFCFIAEELNTSNCTSARNSGYNMIIGDAFWHEPRFKEGLLRDFIINTSKLPCPIFACCETHDTPRIVSREGGKELALMLVVLNMFLPNTVPFINSGQEVYERQPINTGLDVMLNALDMLDESDPFYGKLALFDKYALHYLNEGFDEIPAYLERLTSIRIKYLKLITNVNNLIYLDINDKTNCIAYAFQDHNQKLIIVANLNPYQAHDVVVDLTSVTSSEITDIRQLFSQYDDAKKIPVQRYQLKVNLKAGEVKVLTF